MSELLEFGSFNLPDVYNGDGDPEQVDGEASVPQDVQSLASLALPPGHHNVDSQDAGQCPFAAIQAVLAEKKAADPPPATTAGSGHSRHHHEEKIAVFHHDLGDAIPEDSELTADVSMGTEATPQTSKMGQRQQSFAASKSQAGSDASRSRATRRTKRTTASTRSARSRNRQQAARRTKKAPTFSNWEAQTYIPPIKQSWEDLLSTCPLEQIGVVFYDKLFEVGGHQIEHMFTTEKSVMALKFAEMLASIVGSVDNPYSMYEKLKGLAPMHIEKGVGKEHLPIMGETLFAVLEQTLRDRFTLQIRTAWEWLWAWLGATFTLSLEDAGNDTSLIAQSWNLAMDNFPEETLGELMYEKLFELAPNLRAVFSKPKQILSVKFVEMLSTLVSFHHRLDDGYNEQLVWLGIRHVAYGAKFSHVEVLAEVVLATIETACGSEWTEEMAESWRGLWHTTCSKLLAITVDAEQHGQRVQQLWRMVRERTTRQALGAQLRRMLLSGTEWVQSLSSRGGAALTGERREDGGAVKGAKTRDKSSILSKGDTNGRRTSMESTTDSVVKGAAKSTVSAVSELPPPSESAEEAGADGGKESDAEAIGNQFWELLTVTLDLLWEPERQNEQIILMSTRFFKCGIRREHLDAIGQSLLTSCRMVLANTWTDDDRAAWAWFWQLVSHAMERTLKVLEEEHAEVVRASWEGCKARMEVEELGESIFKELASVAPYVVHLFKRPKRIQAAQFVSAVDILVGFLDDPDAFFVELKQLTIRHIKYGVKADYAKAFGTAVLRGVRHCVGKERWDAETQAAWEMLWDRVNNCLTRCLNAGTNLVIVALVNGDLDKAVEAMDCAPRGERFDTLTRVDVNGEVLSPLTWALRDGLRDIALFLLQDLLTIRADRSAYYYGQEKLFETHPDIVEVLCKDTGAEELMDTLFNGLMWHSHTVHNGKLRVNYYIRELYGDPRAQSNIWESALATLALIGPPQLFEHPVCEKLLETKWKAFGQRMFLAMQLFYAAVTLLFYLGFIVFAHRCAVWGYVRLAAGSLALLAVALQLLLAAAQLRSGQTSLVTVWWPNSCCYRRGRPPHIHIPRTLVNAWNCCRVATFSMIAVAAFSRVCLEGQRPQVQPTERYDAYHILISLVALGSGLQLLEALVLAPSVAALMLLVQRLVPDVGRMLLLVLLLVVAFAGAVAVMKEESFDSLGKATTSIIGALLDLDRGVVQFLGAYGVAVLGVLLCAVQVLMLNALVAQLVIRNAAVGKHSQLLVQQKFAYVCVEMESLLPLSFRCRLFDAMGFDQPLDFEVGDDGPSGGIQQLEPASIRSHPKYKPDRILRFTGHASVTDPWPSSTLQGPEDMELEEEEED